MVNTLQSERDALVAQIQGEKADVLSHGIVARRRAQQGVGPGHIPVMPTMVPGELSQWLEDRQKDLKDAFARDDDIGVLELNSKDGTRCRAVDSVDTSAWNDRQRALVAGSPWRGEIRSVLSVVVGVVRRWFLSVNAKYGLRGVRVGEASNPGPKKRRRRVTSSPDPTDSDRTAFLDGFEQDLCPVVQERRGTQLAPTMIQSPESTLVEESGKVSQLVVDMSVDDSVDEESKGVTHVQPARRRLVLVSTQVESTRPTVEDVDCPGSETESVGSLNDDDHSVQGSLSEVNSEDGPDLRIGGVKARQISEGMESMDEVILGDTSVMKSVPKFVRGPFRMACRVAFDHHATSMARGDRLGQVRAWKFFLMLPRMLLSRPPRGGEVPKKELQDRFAAFARGEWAQLVEASLDWSQLKA